MKKAVYPGTFDPFTNGHLDIIKRSSKLFDEVIILINNNPSKNNLLTIYERMIIIKITLEHLHLDNVKVETISDKYTVDFCANNNAYYLIRGIRNSQDLLYEETIVNINKEINKHVETVFLLADKDLGSVSSSMVKELCKFERWEEISKKFLPFCSYQLILEKYKAGLDKFTKAIEDLAQYSQRGMINRAERYYDNFLNVANIKYGRYYHNLSHILNGLNTLDYLGLTSREISLLTVAFFYHDFHYDIDYPDEQNIKNSLEQFKKDLKCDFDEIDINYSKNIEALILITNHKTEPETYLEGCMIDMDLSGFAVDYDQYLMNSLLIRKEYGKYHDDQWLRGRHDFLESIINKKLFHCHCDRDILEDKFRDNLTKDLKYIKSQLKIKYT